MIRKEVIGEATAVATKIRPVATCSACLFALELKFGELPFVVVWGARRVGL